MTNNYQSKQVIWETRMTSKRLRWTDEYTSDSLQSQVQYTSNFQKYKNPVLLLKLGGNIISYQVEFSCHPRT